MKKKEIILNNLDRYFANPKQVMIELSNTLNTSKSYVHKIMQKEIKMRQLEAVEKARKGLQWQEQLEREKFENKSTDIPIDDHFFIDEGEFVLVDPIRTIDHGNKIELIYESKLNADSK
jgi:hypothetical protein